MINRALSLGNKLLFGGLLSLCLAIIFAEYTSQYLYAHYHTWAGWRSATGKDPNYITSVVQKLSWAFFFVSSWLMLWKLDSFFEYNSKLNASDKVEEKDDIFETAESQKSTTQKSDPDKSEKIEDPVDPIPNFEPEEDFIAKNFSEDDLKHASVLGLEEPFEVEEIKPTYRKIIAQYHPDRVVAMGPEIKEVAEKKAKEINEAYEQLRKNLNIS